MKQYPGGENLTMNVNVSTKQFMDGEVTGFIIKTLEEKPALTPIP
ncbi:MAG: hypothetical protein U5K27_02600 [Desulfotignum sp.]|nr:hypothetical protein [Desulfotignum sp.]